MSSNNLNTNEESDKAVCPWCNHIEELEQGIRSEWFTWTSIEDRLVYLCWNCADKVHSNYINSERAKER